MLNRHLRRNCGRPYYIVTEAKGAARDAGSCNTRESPTDGTSHTQGPSSRKVGTGLTG